MISPHNNQKNLEDRRVKKYNKTTQDQKFLVFSATVLLVKAYNRVSVTHCLACLLVKSNPVRVRIEITTNPFCHTMVQYSTQYTACFIYIQQSHKKWPHAGVPPCTLNQKKPIDILFNRKYKTTCKFFHNSVFMPWHPSNVHLFQYSRVHELTKNCHHRAV